MAQPRVAPVRALGSIGLDEINGLTEANQRELESVGIPNAWSLTQTLKDKRGDLTGLSNVAGQYPIDRQESWYIGDRVLEALWCPQELKDLLRHSGSVLVPETLADVALAQAHANSNGGAQLSKFQKFWKGFTGK